MKDFRKTVNWKKFTEEFPTDGNCCAILVCRIDEKYGNIDDDELTVGYLDWFPDFNENGESQLGLTIFGHTYFPPEDIDMLSSDLVNFVWDYLE